MSRTDSHIAPRVLHADQRLLRTCGRRGWSLWSYVFFIPTGHQYLWPLLASTDTRMKPLLMGMPELVNLDGDTPWGPLTATCLAIVPALLAYLVAQRDILECFVTAGLTE
jgi:ABC-type glycerol-3-phosphate transport system permease component